MKKTISLIAALLMIIPLFAQSNLNKRQQLLSDNIYNYLKQEGYSPEKNSKGISFKKEGLAYLVIIDRESSDPMFIKVQRRIKLGESGNLTKKNASKKLNDYNNTYITKVLIDDNNLLLSAEMFLENSDQFKTAFDLLMNYIEDTYKDIIK